MTLAECIAIHEAAQRTRKRSPRTVTLMPAGRATVHARRLGRAIAALDPDEGIRLFGIVTGTALAAIKANDPPPVA